MIERLLRETFHHTRDAFAAGELRLEQVRVILDVAVKAPKDVTPEQLATAEDWLVGRATGRISRTGRPLSPRRLRQVARRMFAIVDKQLADRHEAALLRREERSAEVETYLNLWDNGDGTWSGRFVIPELHAQLLSRALDRLSAPRRHAKLADGEYDDPTALSGPGWCLNWTERAGMAFLELLEHLPEHGHAARPRAQAPAAHDRPAQRARDAARLLRHRGVRTALRLVRDPSSGPVVSRGPDRSGQRRAAVWLPSPACPRGPVRPAPAQLR